MSQRTEGALVALALILGVVVAANAVLSLSISVPQAPPPPPPPEPVTAIVLLDECPECWNVHMIVEQLGENVEFSNTTTVMAGSQTFASLVDKHGVERVPALIVSDNIREHLGSQTDELFAPSMDGWMALEGVPPPYVNTSTGEVRGVVDITLLTVDCEECYNVSVHYEALGQLGITLGDNQTVAYESSAGQALVEQYNISALPTVIVSDEAAVYTNFENIWAGVGSREEDAFVFRNASLFGAYYDVDEERLIGGSS